MNTNLPALLTVLAHYNSLHVRLFICFAGDAKTGLKQFSIHVGKPSFLGRNDIVLNSKHRHVEYSLTRTPTAHNGVEHTKEQSKPAACRSSLLQRQDAHFRSGPQKVLSGALLRTWLLSSYIVEDFQIIVPNQIL